MNKPYIEMTNDELRKALEEKDTALGKIENYCEQVYQAALDESLSLQTASFMVGAIYGQARKALGKVED